MTLTYDESIYEFKDYWTETTGHLKTSTSRWSTYWNTSNTQ